jgi:hypothetical protein
MKIRIGRSSGPITDREAEIDIREDEMETVKDVLAAVNAVSGGRESWYVGVYVPGEGDMEIVPVSREIFSRKNR